MFVLPDLTCDLVTHWDIPDISITPKFIDKDNSGKIGVLNSLWTVLRKFTPVTWKDFPLFPHRLPHVALKLCYSKIVMFPYHYEYIKILSVGNFSCMVLELNKWRIILFSTNFDKLIEWLIMKYFWNVI